MTNQYGQMPKEKDTITHRGHELLSVLRRLGGSARNAQIAQVMDVSEETVRRLVKALDKSGQVERVHGGTYLRGNEDTPVFTGKLSQNPKGKTRIAQAAAEMVYDEMTVFLNVGSTTTYIAEQLRIRRKLMVVTNSVTVASALANHNGNRVFLAGGEIFHSERGAFGAATEAYARQFSYDVAILGCDAISADYGFMVMNPSEADLTRTITEQARRCVMAADSRKFIQRAPVVACPPERITDLITDAAPDAPLTKSLANWRVATYIANKKD
ncbi:DeoR/GlpR family DNA-binding transcription regulator [Cochlodiniinecator piscidefendens]|uniref:DeoR/GlpR family DNA-binding transcription regulator n=1 Tax=Cochlodiniinecator piscidefendens TaxID=2715756 RepID=UPI001E58EB3F|nr:DeoR/GlpR family DNA-binding transcription regulator [Cochlodiniinecator piscidefendens]